MVESIIAFSILSYVLATGFSSPPKKEDPKTPEQELGEAITKYLSQASKSSK